MLPSGRLTSRHFHLFAFHAFDNKLDPRCYSEGGDDADEETIVRAKEEAAYRYAGRGHVCDISVSKDTFLCQVKSSSRDYAVTRLRLGAGGCCPTGDQRSPGLRFGSCLSTEWRTKPELRVTLQSCVCVYVRYSSKQGDGVRADLSSTTAGFLLYTITKTTILLDVTALHLRPPQRG